MLAVGDTHVELLEPLGPETSVGKFLAKRGPGMHHIAVEVKDIRASLAEFRQSTARRCGWLFGRVCSSVFG